MAAGITKRNRAKQIDRIRNVVTSYYQQICRKNSEVTYILLSCHVCQFDPMSQHITVTTRRAVHRWCGKLVVLSQIAGCTRDVRGIMFVCKPWARKRCWEILHQARSPKLLDAQGNEIERPSLIKKGSGTTVLVLSVFLNATESLLLWILITFN